MAGLAMLPLPPNYGQVHDVGGGGGVSDFVCIDKGFVHKLPDNVPLDVGGLWPVICRAKLSC